MLAITLTTASAWTAAGTLLLAAATFVSLIFARSALKKTQDQIELGQAQLTQTQREIELSRREVEEAHRPVVVPVADTLQRSSRTVRSGPDVSDHLLVIPLRNIGSGPALHVAMTLEPINPVGDVTWGGRQHGITMTGVGASETVLLEVILPDVREVPTFELVITYKDVANKAWTTSGRWNAELGRYENLTIDPD